MHDAKFECGINNLFIYLFICSSFTLRYISYKILPFHVQFIRVNTCIWPFPLCYFCLKHQVLETVSASHCIQCKRLWNLLCWVHWLELISCLLSIQQSFVYFTWWHKQSRRPKRRLLQQQKKKKRQWANKSYTSKTHQHAIITNLWILICSDTGYKPISSIPPVPFLLFLLMSCS
jgi:hypothetical protein